MNPARLGNHNQLTAPLLLWCKAAGPWSFLTWLLVMLMDSDWWWVSVVHWIEWLSSPDRCRLPQESDGCQQRTVTRTYFACMLTVHVYWKCSSVTFNFYLLFFCLWFLFPGLSTQTNHRLYTTATAAVSALDLFSQFCSALDWAHRH